MAVLELTGSADIKLNNRVSLRRPSNRLSISYRKCPCPDLREAEPPGDYIPPGGSVGSRSMRQVAERPKGFQLSDVSPKPAWAEVWHRWHVVFPRRSITGCWLRGDVLRRYDGRRRLPEIHPAWGPFTWKNEGPLTERGFPKALQDGTARLLRTCCQSNPKRARLIM